MADMTPLWAALIAAAAVAMIFSVVGAATFAMAIVRRTRLRPPKPRQPRRVRRSSFAGEIDAGMKWFNAADAKRLTVTSYDGLKLCARYIPAEGARRTVVLVHGYRSSGMLDFSCAFRLLHDLGFNMLIIDQRAHGESEGHYICFGVRERYDVKRWLELLNERYAPDEIYLDGISMGCSTVLMALGLELPDNVRGVIADCGFTSPWDEFVHEFKTKYKLPVFPVLHIANAISRRVAGFGFKDCSTLDALSSNRLPVFFIHGESDRYVPPEMTRRSYDACAAPKRLLTVPDAGHGMSFLYAREAYLSGIEWLTGDEAGRQI